jgi:hypothetical protein
VIPLGIGLLGHEKNTLGTKLNAEAASFAAVGNQMNNATGNVYAIFV